MFRVHINLRTVILLASIAFMGHVIAQTQTQGPYDKLSFFYYSKCFNETGNKDVFQKLYSDFIELQTFLNYTFSFIPEKKDIFCNDHRRGVENRLVEINKDLKPCLPANEKFLAKFVETSFKEFLHFLCHDNGANIDRFFRNEKLAKDCRASLQEGGATKEISQCFSRIFKPSGSYIKKEEVCDDLTTAQRCFTQVLDTRCPRYVNYKSLSDDFFRYIKKPCGACAANMANVVLLVVSLMITYLKIF